jgi:hypothetical protein
VKAPSGPVDLAEGNGGDEHVAITEEAASVDHEIAYGPALVVEQEIGNFADVSVGGALSATFKILQAHQHESYSSVKVVLDFGCFCQETFLPQAG